MKFYAPAGAQDVYRALALETVLLDHFPGSEPVLFCWIGASAVVMGKNQNPWKECNLDWIKDQELHLARRISGGGTVYHDKGNLNISWILPRAEYRAENVHQLLIRTLATLDISAELSKGGSLTVDGSKISGSAFCYRKDRVLHHGTLLVEADLPRLRAALSPTGISMETHAVPSQPASVVNIKTLQPTLSFGKIQRALLETAEKFFGPATPLSVENFEDLLKKETVRLASPEWIWGQTPSFKTSTIFPDGRTLFYKVRKGGITDITCNGKEIVLNKVPSFPQGDFTELEAQLNLEANTFAEFLRSEGW